MGASISLGSLMVRLGVDPKALFVGLAKATNALIRFQKKVGTLGTIGAGFGIGFGIGVKNVIDEAMEFQDSFVRVAKTVAGDSKELEAKLGGLAKEFQVLSTVIPMSTTEINAIGAIAGQLAVPIDYIKEFTEEMLQLGLATNLSAEDAAMAMAKFVKVMNVGFDDVKRFSSVLVELGNNSATTERDILQLSQRIAPAARAINMSGDQVMAFSAAISEVGILTEAGGTAISRVMVEMAAAVTRGGAKLEVMAMTADMSAKDFADAFNKKPAEALTRFIEGLGNLNDVSGEAFLRLAQLGSTFVGQRVRQTLIALGKSSGILRAQLIRANEEMGKAQASTREAARVYATLTSQLTMLDNAYVRVKQHIGGVFIPSLSSATESAKNVMTSLGDLTEGMMDMTDAAKKSAVSNLLWALSAFSLAAIIKVLGGAIAWVVKSIGSAAFKIAGVYGLLIFSVGFFAMRTIEYWDDIVFTVHHAGARFLRMLASFANAMSNIKGLGWVASISEELEDLADTAEKAAFDYAAAASLIAKTNASKQGLRIPQSPTEILEAHGVDTTNLSAEMQEAMAKAMQGLDAIKIKAPILQWDKEKVQKETENILEAIFKDIPFQDLMSFKMPDILQGFLNDLLTIQNPLTAFQTELTALDTIYQRNGDGLKYMSDASELFESTINTLSKDMESYGGIIQILIEWQKTFAKTFDVVGLSIDAATSELTSFSSENDMLQATITGIQNALPSLIAMFGLLSTEVKDAREEIARLQLLLNAKQETGKEVTIGSVQMDTDKSLGGIERTADLMRKAGVPYDMLAAKAALYTKQLEEIGESNTINQHSKDVEGLVTALQNVRDQQDVFELISGSIDSVSGAITSTFDSSLEGIIQGTLTVEQAFANMGRNILLSWIKTLANMAIESTAHWATEKAFLAWSTAAKLAADQTEVAAHGVKEGEKTALTWAAASARQSMAWEEAGSISVAKQTETASFIGNETAKTASSLWSSITRLGYSVWETTKNIALKNYERIMWIFDEGLKLASTLATNIGLAIQNTLLWKAMAPLVLLAAKWIGVAWAALVAAIASAAASAAQVPYIGWAIAIGAGIAVGAVVGGLIAAYAEKGAVLDEDSLVFAHKKEMILPANISKGMQSLIKGKSSTFDKPVSVGETVAREPDYNVNIYAADSKDVARLFNKNGKALAKAGRRQFRNFNSDTRIPRRA